MAIEIVDFPIKHGDFPWQNVSSPEGIPNEIAIEKRDNDDENHWVQWGTQHFQTHPDILSHLAVGGPVTSSVTISSHHRMYLGLMSGWSNFAARRSENQRGRRLTPAKKV